MLLPTERISYNGWCYDIELDYGMYINGDEAFCATSSSHRYNAWWDLFRVITWPQPFHAWWDWPRRLHHLPTLKTLLSTQQIAFYPGTSVLASGSRWVPIQWNYRHWITLCKSNASTYNSCLILPSLLLYKWALEQLKEHDTMLQHERSRWPFRFWQKEGRGMFTEAIAL